MPEHSKRRFITPDHLRDIRNSITDPHKLLDFLNIEPAREDGRDIWALSPFRQETRPSFKIEKATLAWYDHGESRGGGALELVQSILGLDIYAAGQWAEDTGLCSPAGTYSPPRPEPAREEVKEKRERGNEPLAKKLDLRPYLKANHPQIRERGISEETCRALGFGFLDGSSKSPLRNRVVFQIRGVREVGGQLKPVILSHIGRAVNAQQEENDGKWRVYAGFQKKDVLYNLDQVLLNPEARAQVEQFGLLIVEGCYDVAKCHESGVYNVVATLTANLSEKQREGLVWLFSRVSVPRVRFWYDRNKAGFEGTEKALEFLKVSSCPVPVDSFDWRAQFVNPQSGRVSIPAKITDACEFSAAQIQFLRSTGTI